MKQPKDYIVFPLDVPTFEEAMRYVRLLRDHVGVFKIGLELFISQGPRILEAVNEVAEGKIFLDLKLHDIPATMQRALQVAAAFRPKFITVHCDLGNGFLKDVGENTPGGTKILGISVLTSLNRDHLLGLGIRPEVADDIPGYVVRKARIATQAGCHGIVCSGHEAQRVREELGNKIIIVTPGIRPAWSLVEGDDQQRIVTPEKAVRNGTDYIVVGRPVRDADDPASAAEKVAGEIAAGLGI